MAVNVASSSLYQDRNARAYLLCLRAGMKPDIRPDVGSWLPIVDQVERDYKVVAGSPHCAFIMDKLFESMIGSKKYPGLADLLAADLIDAPRQGMVSGAPSLRLVEQQTTPAEDPDPRYPPLPEEARLAPGLSAGACKWLDEYVEYSRQVSPEGYEDFHEACGLWLLSTVAGRRIKIPFSRKQYTPLMIALVARTSLYAKSNTAEAAIQVLESAGLRWLLGSDETTPQKLMSDMSGILPKKYGDFDEDKQEWTRLKLSMSGQRGWYYDEFGSLVKNMVKSGGIMSDFKGLLLKLDNCADSYEYSTQSRGSELIEKPYLSLLGSMTPSDIKASAKAGSDFWNDGFWARIAFITPPADGAIDAPFTLGETPVPFGLQQRLRDWSEGLGTPTVIVEPKYDEKDRIADYVVTRGELPETEISFGSGVYDAWVRYRSALKKIVKDLPTQDLDGSYQRLSIKAIRIAALFASLENGNVIEMRHWAKAQEIAERWRKSLHELYSQVNAGDDAPTYAKKVEDEILRVVKKLEDQEKPPTVRDLTRYLTRVDVGRLKMGVADLVRAGLLAEDKSGKATRYVIVDDSSTG